MRAILVESLNFERGKSAKKSMNIGGSGKGYIKPFENILNDLSYKYKKHEDFDGDLLNYSIRNIGGQFEGRFVEIEWCEKDVFKDENKFGWRFSSIPGERITTLSYEPDPWGLLKHLINTEIEDSDSTWQSLEGMIEDYQNQLVGVKERNNKLKKIIEKI